MMPSDEVSGRDGVASLAEERRGLVRRQLGRAIRQRRHAASLTLATVSERAGISVSMLSQVERGLLDPSLDTLRSIAEALGTAPFRLLAEESAVTGVVRRGEGRVLQSADGKYRFELLSPSLDGAFEIGIWELRPGESNAGRPCAHPGEKANLVLQGRAVLEIGHERIEIGAGDCITFDPRQPHRVTAVGDETVVCVDVISPPYF
jgi:transcriptional regulator with XRE-family HTH domain